MKIINVAIIGYGLSGRIFHGAIIGAVKGFKVKSIVTTDTKKAEQAKIDFPDVSIVESAESVFNDETIDLVVISTPNTSHFSLAEKALNSGKHVVIEKPFTVTTHDALRLIDLQHDTKKILSVYHNRRFDGDYQTIKELINNDELGRLVEFESHFDRFRNTMKDNAWREQDLPGSGMLYDLGAHLIDQALDLFGLPQEVYADMSSQRRGPVDDSFEIILYYSELKVTLKSSIHVKEPLPRFILNGSDGSFVKYGLDVQEPQLKDGIRPNDPQYGIEDKNNWGILNTAIRKSIETKKGDYTVYYENIYQAITQDKPLLISAHDGFNVMRIIEAAKHSHHLGARIQIKH